MMWYNRKPYYEGPAPVGKLVRFLTCDGMIPLECVEFGARFCKTQDDRSDMDMRRRGLIYSNATELRQDLCKRTYCSLEVGMIIPFGGPEGFSHISLQTWRDYFKDRHDAFNVMKPLVFDWDLDTKKRDAWNKCDCEKTQVCSLCWAAFAEPARMALLRVLRFWMGYSQIVCIFSGRRGFHTWVLDKETYHLTVSQREAIFAKVCNPIKYEPMYNDICSILLPYHKKYHQHYSRDVWDIFYDLDKEPTLKMNHMIGVPLMPNAYTGNLRLPIEVVDFDPTREAKKCTHVSYQRMQEYAEHLQRVRPARVKKKKK